VIEGRGKGKGEGEGAFIGKAVGWLGTWVGMMTWTMHMYVYVRYVAYGTGILHMTCIVLIVYMVGEMVVVSLGMVGRATGE
jgi:hypothetical protein